MAISLDVKVNNQQESQLENAVIITNDSPTVTWSFSPITGVRTDEHTGSLTDLTEVGQLGYEVRISTSDINIGTEFFIGNRVQTGFIISKDRFFNYVGYPLARGRKYYGQVYIQDEYYRESEWRTFSFYYNSLPIASSVSISPVVPTINDNLQLSYSYYDEDEDKESGTIIRWFINGIQQRQFDNLLLIKSEFLQINDVWIADILPSDGYEYGGRETSPMVKVSTASVEVEEAKILPLSPNENDILKAEYVFSDVLEQDDATIRWFINGVLANTFNDKQYIRTLLSPGDTVRYEVKPNSGTIYVSSPETTIGYSDFLVYNIKIDGQQDPLEISTIKPVVTWKNYISKNKEINYVSIKIGTFYEADNIYSTIIQTNKNTFVIPANLLNMGMDYYISIAISDTMLFDKYELSHFRMRGSRWEEAVDNSVGWTIETLFAIIGSGTEEAVYNESLYHIIKIQDGTKFGEVKIYDQKISFMSEEFIISEDIDTTGMKILTIVAKNDNIYIYVDRELVINGEGKFTQLTNTKLLEMGNNTNENFVIDYKYFCYTVSGNYNPGVSIEYSNIQFHELIGFKDTEAIALKSYTINNQDYKVFGINPDSEDDSGSIFSLIPNQTFKNSTVNRTFAPINNIKISPNNEKIACAHSKGVSIITGYQINNFDNNLDFTATEEKTVMVNNEEQIEIAYPFPENNGWELIQNRGIDAASFDENGLNIDTLGNV